MTRRSSSVTIRDVAQKAGVSVATVSRFLNQSAIVSPAVAERIQQVMADLHYAPHMVARNLATHKTNTIGLLLTNMHNDFFGPLLSGIEEAVSQNSYHLLVATYRPDLRNDLPIPIGPHNTDGLVVFVDSLNDAQLNRLYSQKFPVILIHRTPPKDLPIPSVTVENKAATRKLIDHLIDVHNKRRIIFMRGPQNQEDSTWRELGYRESIKAHYIPYDPALILNGEFERELACDAMTNFLSNGHPPFDAVFAGDDDAAVGVIEALRHARLRVPEDVAVVGFDDQRLSPFLRPPLTTVKAPTEEVGRRATQLLFALLRGEQVDLVTLLPTEIVLRRSCGCQG